MSEQNGNKNQPLNIVISGASGLIGQALFQHLSAKGHHVRRLVRSRPKSDTRKEIYWNPKTNFIESSALEGADVVINLSGKNIADRFWTKSQKKALLNSRIESTKLLCHAIKRLKKPPKLLISASAIGFYGDRGSEEISENSKPGLGFLSSVCRKWEDATYEAKQKGVPVIFLRTGLVLSKDGGLLKKQSRLFRLGLGAVLGAGDQYLSWISITDLVRAVEFLITTPELEGPFNLVSPEGIEQKKYADTLARVLNRPCALSLPDLFVKLFFGQMGQELILSSVKASPEKLLKSGFQFEHPRLNEALLALLKRK